MSELTPRERAFQVAKWLFLKKDKASDIDDGSIIPITARLSYKHIEVVMAGVSYVRNGYEYFYLVGAGPYERLLSMTGESDSQDICLLFSDKPFYVSSYLPQDSYDQLSQMDKDRYYPFGANLTLRESNDRWLCNNRTVVSMKVDFDLTAVLS